MNWNVIIPLASIWSYAGIMLFASCVGDCFEDNRPFSNAFVAFWLGPIIFVFTVLYYMILKPIWIGCTKLDDKLNKS